ncbi:lysophospholipid acyltransferase family protein [Kordiimonas pumila]|uniref:Lysophospholipid acyltransferase family protein n=1 Tax=Kordiimonas pumila TaxID=2161677 RepID=A0ABV7CZI9_9PROT|nr:lysophospholipid acyltransferase family protein [Kordiimonas pumila]
MDTEYAGLKSNFQTEGWTLLGFVRICAIILVSIPLISVQVIMVKAAKRRWWHFAGLWHRTTCRILGVDIHVIGLEKHTGPVLYAANHISWLDILVLGGLLDNASFIAKAEMAGWGLVGKLCALHKTIFVRRERRLDSARQRDELVARVQQGHSLILFPEGTSTDGVRVENFKSSLFSVAERADAASGHRLVIQPVTLAYTETNGMPLVRSRRPSVAWLGDVELFEHLRQFLGLARTSVTLEFHAPISLVEAGSRKELARYCEDQVRAGLERAHRSEVRFGPQPGIYLPAPAEQQA